MVSQAKEVSGSVRVQASLEPEQRPAGGHARDDRRRTHAYGPAAVRAMDATKRLIPLYGSSLTGAKGLGPRVAGPSSCPRRRLRLRRARSRFSSRRIPWALTSRASTWDGLVMMGLHRRFSKCAGAWLSVRSRALASTGSRSPRWLGKLLAGCDAQLCGVYTASPS